MVTAVLNVALAHNADLGGVQAVSDKALGGAMLLVASVVFAYYTTWAILLVSHKTSALTSHLV